jgi:hypothetical protein
MTDPVVPETPPDEGGETRSDLSTPMTGGRLAQLQAIHDTGWVLSRGDVDELLFEVHRLRGSTPAVGDAGMAETVRLAFPGFQPGKPGTPVGFATTVYESTDGKTWAEHPGAIISAAGADEGGVERRTEGQR